MTSILNRDMRAALPEAVGGDGIWLIDAEGRRYADACCGAAVSCLGHNHPAIRDAIVAQLGKLEFAHNSFFSNAPSERLADMLVARAPAGFGKGRAVFLGSGSEAMEAALKLARQYFFERGETGRTRFIGREMSYHGNSLGALAVGHHPVRRAPYAEMLMEVGRVPALDSYRGRQPGEGLEAFGERMAAALEAEILRMGPETVAAFVSEPVSGASLGCAVPPPGYFARVREICDRYGVLMIADEVMCGSGRTGTFFALEQEGVTADIFTIAKGMGAGYQPIAATLASERVVAALLDGSGALKNGHTYMSHATACAAGVAVLETFEREDLLANVRARGEQLRTALEARFGQHPHVGDIRGRGLFQAVEFVADRETKAPFPREKDVTGAVKRAAFAAGLMVYPSQGCVDGSTGDLVILAPPYTVTPEEIEMIVDRLELAVRSAIAA